VIRLPGVRDKGAGLHLGARHPGELGPFGVRPDEDGGQGAEEQHDDQAEQ
jgi:hypothetical protein